MCKSQKPVCLYKVYRSKNFAVSFFPRYAFSKNGLPAIASKNPSITSFGNSKNGEARNSVIEQIKKAYCKSRPAVISK